MSIERHCKTGGLVVIAALLLATLPGCQKEGPMERAGKEVDKTVEKVGQKIEKAGDNIQDAAKDQRK